MHVPDGFINAPVSVAAGAVAAAAVAVSLRGARREFAGAGVADSGSRDSGSADSGYADSGYAGGGGAERTAPLAGLVAAFIFAVQMLNFPIGAGTSGHLLGGALAAILVGPYTGVLCVSVVLLMQGVLFADGGLTALGVNVTDMAVVTTLVAYGVFRVLVTVLPRGRRAVTVASFAAALVSVPAAAAAFTGLYALGGTADVPIGKVFTAMVGVHVLIGIGEAAITALTVGAVIAVRPDLVHGARGLTHRLELRTVAVRTPVTSVAPATPTEAGRPGPAQGEATSARDADAPAEGEAGSATGSAGGAPAAVDAGTAPGAHPGRGVAAAEPAAVDARRDDLAGAPVADDESAAPAPGGGRRGNRKVWFAGLAAALVCAGGISYYASADPDGLEKVAQDKGIDAKAEEHAAKDSPLADYGVKDVSDARLSGGLAGVIGVGATLLVGSGLFVLVRRRESGTGSGPADTHAHADRDPRSGAADSGLVRDRDSEVV
ncbi:energy-coupling factor ABC transporter permease [Streptomyces sp. XD-27]|uniref:energy-coupling factor ABC transporter permease n=1 Tax=Streptomyces sp. XD-27 TaxID=3062779 RepID=UPI0026F42723|nr:energy-coupling factor ABC transporter permease [Streptomyces sp. XD-27]WKX72221.1 energy-coupling factor ABC transporter permease [Streptomyces sp. XD-27]